MPRNDLRQHPPHFQIYGFYYKGIYKFNNVVMFSIKTKEN